MTNEVKNTDGPTAHASRDKSKDMPVIVNDVVVAIVYAGSDHPVVVWQVYGPQDVDRAYEICKGVKQAIEKMRGGPSAAPVANPSAVDHKLRPASKVFRELIAKGLDDDQVWAGAKAELGDSLPDSSKYRVKEYRREAEKSGAATA